MYLQVDPFNSRCPEGLKDLGSLITTHGTEKRRHRSRIGKNALEIPGNPTV